jgi:hypothetical protein
VFLLLDPLVVFEFDKFRSDIRRWVTDPLTGTWKPIWAAQFTNVEPWSYWFTNVLWWGLGPLFELWGVLGIAWLLYRRDRAGLVAASFAIFYYLTAGRTITPFARYGVPLVPAFAIAAGALSADLLQRPRWRRIAIIATAVILMTTGLYAAAYMNVYRAPDSRLTASRYLLRHVPPGARILVEPSHNIPPTGRYLTSPHFFRDYVMWDRNAQRNDYYRLIALDTYRYLYNPRVSAQEKRSYIARRVALADYILMDDTFLQFYQHLPASAHAVVKQYYEDLFAGRLGFRLKQTFKTYPSLGAFEINDDSAELSFRLFDHPRVFIFERIPSG